jgi:hypothetical protein
MVKDRQVKELRRWIQKEATLSLAALKTGMDRKTARKYRRGKLPSEVAREHDWRTRPDVFAEVWVEVESLLEVAPGLEAKTLFADLQRRYPGRFQDGQLRTLQRRVKHWRATRGPDREVFFAQEHKPGQLGASDFTHLTSLNVTIAGVSFPHLVYHFVLTYSNWEQVTICFSESFESFSVGLQNALWELGAVPAKHRSDRMTLAVNQDGNPERFTARYRALLSHYGMRGQAINAGAGHENGDVEQSHNQFKRVLEQMLLLRGSRDFHSRREYEEFLSEVCARQNAGRQQRLAEERKVLRPLPARRLESFKRLRVRVGAGATIAVERNLYSVPARLIGEWVEARLSAEIVQVWYGQEFVLELPRLRGRYKHHIDYRHVIDWLVRKPGAFAEYRYQADLFPSSRFRMAYDALQKNQPERASREYVHILHLAAHESEAAVDGALQQLLSGGEALTAARVQALLLADSIPPAVPVVTVATVSLSVYDDLYDTKELWDGSSHGCEAAVVDLPEGTAPADLSQCLRAAGAASPAGGVELRELSAGTGDAGMSGTTAQADRALAARITVAVGEEPADLRPQAIAGESGAADARLAGGELCGSARERAGLWQAGIGEDPSGVRPCSGAGPRGPAGVVQSMQPAGAGAALGQA